MQEHSPERAANSQQASSGAVNDCAEGACGQSNGTPKYRSSAERAAQAHELQVLAEALAVHDA